MKGHMVLNNTSKSQQKTLLIVPAFNEEASILAVAHSIQDAGYDYIVINDGSSDNTLSICRDHNIPVLNMRNNLGIGSAVQCGHIYAYKNGYDIDVQFDGDGQHDISCVDTLIKAINDGYDLVIGSRFIESSLSSFQSTGLRRLGIKWLSATIKFMTGKRFLDVTSGFRACSRKAIELFCTDYPIDYPEPESIVTALKHELKVVEVPAKMNNRIGGESSIGKLSSVYYMIKVSLAIIIQGMTRYGRIKNK